MSGYGASLDATSGVIHAVRDGWGDYGYRVQELIGTLDGSAIAEVSSSDGSRFWVAADTYGNIIGQHEPTVAIGFDTAEAAASALHGHYMAVAR